MTYLIPTHAFGFLELERNLSQIRCDDYMKSAKGINANLRQTYTTECRCGIFVVFARLPRRKNPIPNLLQPNFMMDR